MIGEKRRKHSQPCHTAQAFGCGFLRCLCISQREAGEEHMSNDERPVTCGYRRCCLFALGFVADRLTVRVGVRVRFRQSPRHKCIQANV